MATATSAPNQTIGFPIIEQMLREMATGKPSATYERCVATPRKKIAAFRAANGPKGKKEADALELALQRVDQLIDLLRSAKVQAGK